MVEAMRAPRRMVAMLAASLVVSCGNERRIVETGPVDCGAGLEIADAAPRVDAGLVECRDFRENGWVNLDVLVPRSDTEYELPVVEVGRDRAFEGSVDLILGSDPRGPSDPDTVRFAVSFPAPSLGDAKLPGVGNDVRVLANDCYARVTTPSGGLVWEGGSPTCAWEDAWLTSRADPDAVACTFTDDSEECCCSTKRERLAVLRTSGCETLLPVREETELWIGGQRYVAVSFYTYDLSFGPCIKDGDGADTGSVHIVRVD